MVSAMAVSSTGGRPRECNDGCEGDVSKPFDPERCTPVAEGDAPWLGEVMLLREGEVIRAEGTTKTTTKTTTTTTTTTTTISDMSTHVLESSDKKPEGSECGHTHIC